MIFVNTLSRWLFNVSNDIYCVIPQTLDDIQTDTEKVNVFVNYMFVHKTGIMHNTKLKWILAASVMIFHK